MSDHITRDQLADALDCFFNPAVTAIRDASYHGPASANDFIDAIAQGLAAVATHLREQPRIEEPVKIKVFTVVYTVKSAKTTRPARICLKRDGTASVFCSEDAALKFAAERQRMHPLFDYKVRPQELD